MQELTAHFLFRPGLPQFAWNSLNFLFGSVLSNLIECTYSHHTFLLTSDLPLYKLNKKCATKLDKNFCVCALFV